MSYKLTPLDNFTPTVIGNPYHGLVDSGVLTLPNGTTKALRSDGNIPVYATPSEWGVVPDRGQENNPDAYQEDQDNGWLWEPYALVHGFKYIYDQPLCPDGYQAFLFKSGDGKLWSIRLTHFDRPGGIYYFDEPGGTIPIDGPIEVTAVEFGQIHQGSAPLPAQYSLSLDTPNGSGDGYEVTSNSFHREIIDARRDGSQVILRYYAHYGGTFCYLLLDIHDVTASGVSASVTLYANREMIDGVRTVDPDSGTPSEGVWHGVSGVCNNINTGAPRRGSPQGGTSCSSTQGGQLGTTYLYPDECPVLFPGDAGVKYSVLYGGFSPGDYPSDTVDAPHVGVAGSTGGSSTSRTERLDEILGVTYNGSGVAVSFTVDTLDTSSGSTSVSSPSGLMGGDIWVEKDQMGWKAGGEKTFGMSSSHVVQSSHTETYKLGGVTVAVVGGSGSSSGSTSSSWIMRGRDMYDGAICVFMDDVNSTSSSGSSTTLDGVTVDFAKAYLRAGGVVEVWSVSGGITTRVFKKNGATATSSGGSGTGGRWAYHPVKNQITIANSNDSDGLYYI